MNDLEFTTLLQEWMKATELSQKQIAARLNISMAYLSDMKKGRRLPSVRFVNALLRYTGRGPEGRKVWNLAAALLGLRPLDALHGAGSPDLQYVQG